MNKLNHEVVEMAKKYNVDFSKEFYKLEIFKKQFTTLLQSK